MYAIVRVCRRQLPSDVSAWCPHCGSGDVARVEVEVPEGALDVGTEGKRE